MLKSTVRVLVRAYVVDGYIRLMLMIARFLVRVEALATGWKSIAALIDFLSEQWVLHQAGLKMFNL